MSIYKRYSDKIRSMYFMIKDKKKIDKYMTISEKVCNIIKININMELIYNKKYLKPGKKFNTKGSFQCFYIPVILFDLVNRKDGNYCPKVFLEKIITFFGQKNNKFCFLGLWKLLLKKKKIPFSEI